MSDVRPSEAELMLLMATIIKESIVESIEIGTEDEAQELISDMVNGLIDTLGIDFVAWSPQNSKAMIAIDMVHPTEYFE